MTYLCDRFTLYMRSYGRAPANVQELEAWNVQVRALVLAGSSTVGHIDRVNALDVLPCFTPATNAFARTPLTGGNLSMI